MRLPLLTASLLGLMLAAPAAAQPPARRPSAPHLTAAEVRTAEHVYKQTPQGDLKLHFYLPPDWKASDKRPAVVFFFGGGWKNGSYNQFAPQAEYFASRGLVAASADYRIASVHHTTPDKCVEDAKSAVRWLRAKAGEFGVDPDRIAAGGGSAGGHLAAATALVPGFDADDKAGVSCKPNALLLFNPALNLTRMPIHDADGKDVGAAISPTRFLAKDAPPAIIFFGTDDRLAPQGHEYRDRGKELGCRVELFTAKGQPHGFFNRPPYCELTVCEADRFLVSLGYLAGEPTVTVPAGAPSLVRVSE
jgi:acetyl esterase/lipase